jgi:hypothetical protein
MSQFAVEAAMGRLICDDSFRSDFRRNPKVAAERAGLELTAVELASLRSVSIGALERLAASLDDRIRRAEDEIPKGVSRNL